MNKHFNIKNLVLITFMFVCFFTLGSNVKAADLTCNYRLDGGQNENTLAFTLKYSTTGSKVSAEFTSDFDNQTAGDNGWKSKDIEFTPGEAGTSCPKTLFSVNSWKADDRHLKIFLSYSDAKEKIKDTKTYDIDGYSNTYTLINSVDPSGGNSKSGETCELYLFNSTINTNNKKLTIYKSTNESEKPTLALDGRYSDDTKKYVVNFTTADVKSCPNYVYLKYQDEDDGSGTEKYTFTLTQPSSGTYDTFKGNVEIHKKSSDSSNENNSSCSKLGGAKKYITWVFNLLRYLVPTLIIIFSTVEFLGVVLSGEDEKMEKAKKHFIIRLVIGVIIILIPFFVEFFLKIIGVNGSFNDIVCNIIK